MSFVECMECGDQLKCITSNHLKRHGLTSKQYGQRYPMAPMLNDNHKKSLRTAVPNRQLNRICRKCGRPFTTGSPKAHYCRECQRVRRVLQQRKYVRRYERRLRNSGKDNWLGTFERRYLKIVNGRVQGAILLEKHVSINAHGFYRLPPYNGKAPFDYEETYVTMIYLIIWNRKIFCGECGSELTVARENEHYTISAELCCKNCGLVYELDDLAELT